MPVADYSWRYISLLVLAESETQGLVRHVVHEKNALKLGVDFVDTSAEDKKKLQKFLYGQTHTIG